MDEVSAANNGAPLSAIALAWLRAQSSVSVPIASARTVPQLEEIVQVVELTPVEVEKLNAISA
jgi:aryl-alcohol dehydrogenase-like predicted oxidoreductase